MDPQALPPNQILPKILTSSSADLDRNVFVEYLEDLGKAQIFAQRALEALYSPSGPKRGFYTRIVLARAQKLLMGLYVMEIKRERAESGP